MDKTDGYESILTDVSVWTARDLISAGEPHLIAALRQLLAEREHPRVALLGWSSAVLPEAIVSNSVDDTTVQHAKGEQSETAP
ncbi:hypothetical protein Rhe02_01810 [Rhizocola hellebori]|uniref:Uncharacterized protein n=1 Tax=Rhizocola hellebori TaxID=1392758 RepID=A0A8J3Q1W8_9ACTN|nr:hypothetical protein [Rhizocola hellebori]GIH02114.1 hypothetical protein Rhe02_01810 [Rhizocola hellebori]